MGSGLAAEVSPETSNLLRRAARTRPMTHITSCNNDIMFYAFYALYAIIYDIMYIIYAQASLPPPPGMVVVCSRPPVDLWMGVIAV